MSIRNEYIRQAVGLMSVERAVGCVSAVALFSGCILLVVGGVFIGDYPWTPHAIEVISAGAICTGLSIGGGILLISKEYLHIKLTERITKNQEKIRAAFNGAL